MKRIIVVIALIMCIFFSGCTKSQEQSTETYVDPSGKYSLICPDGMVMDSENKDGFIYFYKDKKAIPYLMFCAYESDVSFNDFIDEFNTSMNRNYGDVGCRRTDKYNNNVGGKKVTVLKYAYTLEEQNILDIRYVLDDEDRIYVFTEKTVPALDQNLSNDLDFLIRNFSTDNVVLNN